MMIKRYLKTLSQWSQTVTLVFWIEIASKLQSINDWLRNSWKSMPLIIDIHKSHVKGSIVGNEYRILAEVLKFLQDLLQRLRIFDMLICNPRQICRKSTQRMPRIDKLVKLGNDIALVHLTCRDLNQVIVNSRQTGSFHVKDNISGFLELHIHFVISNRNSVFHDISFHAVNQLNTCFFRSFITMRKALHIPVVCNSNCLMSPLSGCRNQFLHFWKSIHS